MGWGQSVRRQQLEQGVRWEETGPEGMLEISGETSGQKNERTRSAQGTQARPWRDWRFSGIWQYLPALTLGILMGRHTGGSQAACDMRLTVFTWPSRCKYQGTEPKED